MRPGEGVTRITKSMVGMFQKKRESTIPSGSIHKICNLPNLRSESLKSMKSNKNEFHFVRFKNERNRSVKYIRTKKKKNHVENK